MSSKEKSRPNGKKGEASHNRLVQAWLDLSPAVQFVLRFVFSLLVHGAVYARCAALMALSLARGRW